MNKPLTFLALLITCFLFLMNTSICEVTGEDVNNGAISIVFDDNYDNQLEYAWPLMEERNLVGTYYVLTNTVNTPGYLSYTDLQTLQAAGNEIASHSVTHRSFTLLEEQQIRDECSNSKSTLEAHGLIITNFAYPNGYTTNGTDNIVDDYYASGRTAYDPPFLVDLPADQFRIPAFSAEDSGNELVLLENMVDQVVSSKGWGIFLFHRVIPDDYSNDYTTSQEDFETFLDYILFKGVQTITVKQGLDVVSLSMDANVGAVSPGTGTYVFGSEVVIEAVAPVAGVGERFVWEGWSGSGVGSYSGTNNPVTITLNDNVNQVAIWRHEYKLATSSNHGQVVPPFGDHWYEEGIEVVIEAVAPVAGVGERFVWEGWSGSGVGSYSGTNNPISITMNSSINQISSWAVQYQIFITQNGVGSDFSGNIMTINGVTYSSGKTLWVDDGSFLSFSFIPELPINQGKKYLWETSSGISSQRSGTIIISGSGSIIANYNTQFYLELISVHGNTNGSGWYNQNELVYPTINNVVINETEDVRYLFSGWTADGLSVNMPSNSIILNNSLLLEASWQKQYLFVFNQEGVPIGTEVFILVNSQNQSLPYSIWTDEGDIVAFDYQDSITSVFGEQYLLNLLSDQTKITSNSPIIITATYSLQNDSDLFIIGVIIAIFVGLLFVIIFLRKRNMI